jgi:hypothetical protein
MARGAAQAIGRRRGQRALSSLGTHGEMSAPRPDEDEERDATDDQGERADRFGRGRTLGG